MRTPMTPAQQKIEAAYLLATGAVINHLGNQIGMATLWIALALVLWAAWQMKRPSER